MPKYSLHNKTFSLKKNSEFGTVNDETIFKYQQTQDIVTADYRGGTVIYGKIIAKLKGNQLDMLYQCITQDSELKAGKAIADISETNTGKLQLDLHWQWLESDEKGQSTYIEN